LPDRLAGWKFILEEDYSIDLVLCALKKFLKENTTMPVPAHIAQILNPPTPEITTAEFIHAKEQWKLGGFSQFCDHRDIVKAYEKQTQDRKDSPGIQNKEISALVSKSINKIGAT
jgi:hypothetical protein